MKLRDIRLVHFNSTALLITIILIFAFSSCDKRRPKYTQVIGENFNSEPIKAINLNEEYLVFIFMSPECPLSENYTKTIKDLSAQFAEKDIGFYFVFPGKFYPRPQIEVFIKRYQLPEQKIIYDPDYLFQKYFSATITPEVFLTDVTGTILYEGAIDNWAITLGNLRQVITEHYLADAIVSVLKNENIKTKKTRAVGCIIE